MINPIYTDPVRLSALGQLLYRKPVEKRPSDIPSKLEEDVIRIEGVSAQKRVTPVYETSEAQKEKKVELHDYQGKSIDLYV
jgi:hypothetical protein